jgi:septal ring factor EnvC (AmiA/AmiB activator)
MAVAGLSAAVDSCIERIEAEVGKLQAELELYATEAGATELRKSISVLTEQLQALTSQEEQDMQDINSKLAAQVTLTEQLRLGSFGLMVS